MMAKMPKPGDVVELNGPNGNVYLQYLGKHAEYGDGVTVCPWLHTGRLEPTAALFRDGYVAFFPVVAAVARGLASIVGRLMPVEIPTLLRRPGVRSPNRVETWIIEDGGIESVKTKLSDAERRLPIAAIWNRELLLQRVAEGWRPEMEG